MYAKVNSSASFCLLESSRISPLAASSLVLSMLAHTALIASSSYGFVSVLRIKQAPLLEQYSVRQLTLRQAETKLPSEAALESGNWRALLRDREFEKRSPESGAALDEEMRSFLESAATARPFTEPELNVSAFLAGAPPVFTLRPVIVAPVNRWAWSSMFKPAPSSAFEFVGTPVSRDGEMRRHAARAASTGGMTWLAANATGGPPRTEHILLPKDGRFGVVVVGDAIENSYAEALPIWKNRSVYSAFLNVGSGKNWILQYARTRAAEAGQGGSLARVDAPWPYEMIRPDLPADQFNTGTLLVHGIVNEAGRFEDLAIAAPAHFQYESFVLEALRQWRFRPARKDRQPIAVEVLLIIPG